jgi:hypothetical protein
MEAASFVPTGGAATVKAEEAKQNFNLQATVFVPTVISPLPVPEAKSDP